MELVILKSATNDRRTVTDSDFKACSFWAHELKENNSLLTVSVFIIPVH